MPYAPHSLSYSDGLEAGARKERARITDLIMSHYRTIDIYDVAILDNFTDLLEAITNTEEKTDEN